MERTYRTKRSYLSIGLMGALMGSSFFVGGIAMCLFDHTCKPGAGYFFSAIGLLFLTLSVYLMLVSLRQRLFVSENRVEHEGISKKRGIDLRDLTEARWSLYSPLGKLILRTDDVKIVIEFDEYPRTDGKELVQFFRHRLPETIQQGWDKYWNHFWPKFEEPDTSTPEETREATRKTRFRLFYIVLGGYFILALCGFFVWRYLRQSPDHSLYMGQVGKQFAMAFVFLTLFVLLIVKIGASVGKVQKKHSLEMKGEGLVKFGFLGAFATIPACFGLNWWLGICDFREGNGFIVCISIMSVFAAVMFYGTQKVDKARNKWKEENAKEAEKLYLSKSEEAKEIVENI